MTRSPMPRPRLTAQEKRSALCSELEEGDSVVLEWVRGQGARVCAYKERAWIIHTIIWPGGRLIALEGNRRKKRARREARKEIRQHGSKKH